MGKGFLFILLTYQGEKFLRSPQALYLIGHKQVAHGGLTKLWEKGQGMAMVGIYQLQFSIWERAYGYPSPPNLEFISEEE